ncbi:uncharacterized protein ACJ7VT_017718 isoform 1-T1 [Polymixia lowei]
MGRSSLFVLCWALLASSFCQSVPTFQFPTINSIKDLSRIEPGHVFPRHGLMVLYYLAMNVNIDQNDVIRINIHPDRGDAGFHFYGDWEGLFPSLPYGTTYYSLGNINLPRATELTERVTWNSNQRPTGINRNRDRVLISYQYSSNRVQAIYITQHYLDHSHSYYDIDNTYQITTELLREIQGLSLEEFLYEAGYQRNSYSQTCHILQSSALSLSKTSSPSDTTAQSNVYGSTNSQMCPAQMANPLPQVVLDYQCGQINLEVKTTTKGYAQMKWDHIPLNLMDSSVNVQLYRYGQALQTVVIGSQTFGTYDTSEYMNKDLQLNLVNKGEVIIRGPVTDDADGKVPVDIMGYDAALQMFTKDSYAGARLYIKKTFTDWKTKFYYSWVGFYEERFSSVSGYYTFQWITKFTKEADTDMDYDIYSYCSSMAIHPLAQAQFVLTKSYDSVRAITLPWEA